MKIEKQEIDHEYTDEIVCPHCGYEYFESYEFAGKDGHHECDECGNKFYWVREVTAYYKTKKSKK